MPLELVPLDPLPDVPLVPLDVVVVDVDVAGTTLLTVLVELLDDELPVSCTPSARAVKPEVPTTPFVAEGAVGPVMPDCFVFMAAVEIAGSVELMIPAPL